MAEKNKLLANQGGGGVDKPTAMSPGLAAILEDCDADQLTQVIATDPWAVNHVDKDGYTPLFYAVNKDNVAATEILLRHGADVDVTNSEGDTVLHVAAQEDRSLVMPILLPKTRNPAKLNAKGRAPIHIAALQGHTTIIEQLCDIGAVRHVDKDGETPLSYAVFKDHVAATEILLRHGADVDVTDSEGDTVLHVAARDNRSQVMPLLLERTRDPVKLNALGDAPIHIAAMLGHTTIIEQLCDIGAVSHVDIDGETPLFYAVYNDNVAATEVLLRHGADVDVTNNMGSTVLHDAALYDRSQVMPLLLERTRDPAKPYGEGEAPIHIAVQRGHTTIIEQLCDIGADINLTLNQSTPLHLAIKAKQIKTAMVLITRGAKLDLKDKDGNVPLHLASELGDVDAELVKELVKTNNAENKTKNNNGDIPLHIAARGGHYKSVEILIDHGSPIKAMNNSGATPLHDAAGNGFTDTIEFIIKQDKLLCNDKDGKGYTPLHHAVKNGRDKAVDTLLETYSTKAFAPDGLMDLALDGGHQNVARSLVLSKFWEKFMMTGKMLDDERRRTPMLRLIKDMPEVAKLVMDQCLDAQGQEHIVARFELLDDRFTTWGLPKYEEDEEKPEVKKKLIKDTDVFFDDRPFTTDVRVLTKCHPMKVLAETKNSQLLNHPLVRILLRRKWYRAAPVYLSFLAFYTVYIALIFAYMTLTTPRHGKDLCLGDGDSSGGIGAVTRNGTNESDGTMAPKLVQEYGTSMMVIRILIVFCVIIGLATELLQMAQMNLRKYLYLQNLCDWFTYISPLLIVTSFNACGAMTEWQYKLGTICVFVSCLNLIYFIRVMPYVGIYVMIFVLMMRNLVRFFIIMFLFIITFGLCFFLLLQNQMPFSTPFFSIMKSWVMMVGEMDFTDVIHGHRESDDPNAEMYSEPLTWSLFLVFLVMIILMNLLTSLAVNAIDSLREDSKYCTMALQIELSLIVELALPVKMQRRLGCVVPSQCLKTRRNKAVGKLIKWLQMFAYGDLCEEAMVKDAQQIIQERKDDGNKEEVKKALTNNDVELAVYRKTKDMGLEVKEVDKKVENIDQKVENIGQKMENIEQRMKDAQQIIQELKDDGNKEEVKIDKKVESIVQRMKTIENHIADMHVMLLKLTEGIVK